MKTTSLSLLLSLSLPSLISACHQPDYAQIRENKKMLLQRELDPKLKLKRQVPPASSSLLTSIPLGSSQAPAPTGPPPSVPTDPYATIPASIISSGMPTEIVPTLTSTPQAGATPPVSGAPVLPALTITATTYPPVNTVPPTDSPQVSAWMKEIAGIDPNILAITPTVDGSCANDPSAAADTSRCWWTCGGCVNTTSDIATCPDKNTWGVSFDDGPAPYTPKVLHFLDQNHLNATFFAIGSRIVERPAILQAEYMSGHHISVHTWSHSIPLTALTNEQIVAELGWGREAIKEVLGVTPITMRPPWGDADNRVRAISMAMGLKPIFWTREPTTLAQFDTNDWRVVAGQVTGEQSEEQFQSILTNASLLDTGFIVLEHDLFQQEVDLSTGNFLPQALAKGFTLMDINSCQHLANTEAYLETVQNKSSIPTYPGAGGIDITGNGTTEGGNPSATGSGSSGSAQGGAAGGSKSAGVRLRIGSTLLGLALPLVALAALL